jgi:hypothetical protein
MHEAHAAALWEMTGDTGMQKDGLERMLDFLDLLREKKIWFFINQYSDEGLTVTFTLVGVRVEVEFFIDHLEFSVFRGSEAVESDEKALLDLIKEHRG